MAKSWDSRVCLTIKAQNFPKASLAADEVSGEKWIIFTAVPMKAMSNTWSVCAESSIRGTSRYSWPPYVSEISVILFREAKLVRIYECKSRYL